MLTFSSTDSRAPKPGHCSRGFTLVELMVALVVGLVVTLAAVGFVASVARANSENIRVTRLTQELRSLSEVISREIRRARYVRDPISNVNQGGVPVSTTQPVAVKNSGRCINVEYELPPPSTATNTYSIYLNTGDNRVYIAGDPDCGATLVGDAISTREVSVDTLQFTYDGAFRVDQRMVGKLASGTQGLTSINREFRQTVFIRSGQVN